MFKSVTNSKDILIKENKCLLGGTLDVSWQTREGHAIVTARRGGKQPDRPFYYLLDVQIASNM